MKSTTFHSMMLGTLTMFAISIPSAEADVWCSGTIAGVYVNVNGGVNILPSFRQDWLEICNVTTTRLGVTVDVCKAWLALVTSLHVTQQSAAITYTGSTACNAIPTYQNSPAPVYVMMHMQ